MKSPLIASRPRNACCVLIAALLWSATATSHAAETPPNIPPEPAPRIPQTQLGITQLSNDQLTWLLDAKFGMFIHWGLYAVPARGEWFMENQGMLPDQYRKFAYPDGDKPWFDASDYHPEAWAALAKDAGMKWMCLTTRHHDGFCLFDSPAPNAFTSMQTLHRDLVAEYATACRNAGLKVGLYYSPLSWRYPGYYDVTGTHCLPNKFGYTTDPAHLENARLMKQENYINVQKLLTAYGPINYIFWDGGWLGQHGSDADGAYFHEPGKYLDPTNHWPIDKQYQDIEQSTGKPLGIMGMVRQYQPEAITNLRYGWMGDIIEEEGPRETTGNIRSSTICDKCLTIQDGGWGYNAQSIAAGKVMSRDQLISYLANCVIRNMVLLVNVGPDRHGVIPDLEQKHLHEMGQWLAKTGDAIYATRAGPWQPVDKQYGYCYKDSTIYIHLLKAYPGTTFQMPPLGNLHVTKISDVYTTHPLPYDGDQQPLIHNLDRTSSPADTIIAVVYDHPIESIWKK
jgi:alpha-L-fucosidase